MQKCSKTYSSWSKNYRNKGGRRLHLSIVAKHLRGVARDGKQNYVSKRPRFVIFSQNIRIFGLVKKVITYEQ